MLCQYECKQEAKFQLKNGKWCCSDFYTKCPENRRKNSIGLIKAHKENPSSYSHLYNKTNYWDKGGYNNTGSHKYKTSEILVYDSIVSFETIRKRILEEKILEYKCNKCGIDEWLKKPIVLDLHHKNSKRIDNRIENLELLCPNCHKEITNPQKQKNTSLRKCTISWIKRMSHLSWDDAPTSEKYRRILLEQNEKCLICGIDKNIKLHLDHRDGNTKNSSKENLRFLCPNCHSQTETYGSKNIKRKYPNFKGKQISNEELILAIKETKNIHQALIKVGLAPVGGNWNRAKKLKLSILGTKSPE